MLFQMTRKSKSLIIGTIGLLAAMAAGVVFFVAPPRVEVRCRIEASRPFSMEFYFVQDEAAAFRERIAVNIPKGASDVAATIPVKHLRKLRVDFGSAPGVVKIGRLHVCGQPDVLLDWNDFKPKKDIQRYDVQPDGTLVLASRRNDPYVVYDKPLDVGTRRFCGRRFYALFAFALLMLVALFVLLLGMDVWLWSTLRSACARVVSPFVREWQLLFRAANVFLRRLWADKPFLVYMAVVVLLGWGFELANFTYTFDDDVILFQKSDEFKGWVTQGRWAMYGLWALMGNPSVPVLPLLLTLILYSLSFCMMFEADGKFRYVLFPLYATFPLLFLSFSFSSLNPGVGFGFLFATCAVRLSEKENYIAILGSIFLAMLAISFYQVFALYVMIGMGYVLVKYLIRDDALWMVVVRSFLRMIFILVASFCCYKIVQWCFSTALNVNATFENRYVIPISGSDAWMRWSRLIWRKIWYCITGSSRFFPQELWGYSFLLKVAAVFMMMWMFVKKHFVKRILCVCGCVAILMLPFSVDLINANAAFPLRVIAITLPLASLSFVSLAMRMISQKRKVYLCLISILCMISGWQFLWGLNQLTFMSLRQNRKDQAFIEELQNRINSIPEFALLSLEKERRSSPTIPLCVIGNSFYGRGRTYNAPEEIPWPDREIEIVGRSLLSVPNRFGSAFRAYGNTLYTFVPAGRCSMECVRFIETMPVWPLNGSVAVFDGMVIIKFSDHMPGEFPRGGKTCSRNGYRINGFEELIYTKPEVSSLVDELAMPSVQSTVRCSISGITSNEFNLAVNGARDPQIHFKPVAIDVPYSIMEISVNSDKPDMLGLWKGLPRQMCLFSINQGENLVRLRVPSYFLKSGMRLDPGTGKASKMTLSIRIYADRKYTENLLKLNPELKDSPLLLNGGNVR